MSTIEDQKAWTADGHRRQARGSEQLWIGAVIALAALLSMPAATTSSGVGSAALWLSSLGLYAFGVASYVAKRRANNNN